MTQDNSMYEIAQQISAQTPGPRPWVRYFARSIDHLIIYGLASIVVGIAYIMGMRPGFQVWLIWCGFITVGGVAIEAILMSTFGATPGKAMLGVQVRTNAGEYLNFFQALSRAGGVWVRGEGLGIPPFSLITLIVAYNKLMGDRITSWDRDGGTKVDHAPCGPGRVARGLAAGFAASFVLSVIGGMLAAFGLPESVRLQQEARIAARPHSFYQAIDPTQAELPSTITLSSNKSADHASDPSPRQAMTGTWLASSPATSNGHKLTITTSLTLNSDGSFHETQHCTDAKGDAHPEFSHELSGTWELAGERLIEHVTTTSTKHHPTGSWVYDLTRTNPDAIQLRRVSTPPSYASASRKPVLTFQRQQASAQTE
ncbi:MAG: hypothetical protein JWN24_2511 [Phycisphaerales bacterium]|nr:hypothetical protein [Phycisphaerales bacterium]